MKLILLHYHLRPGGIRRIIELATPHLVKGSGGVIKQVVLAAGETADRQWRSAFRDRLSSTPVDFFIEPAFNYLSEQHRTPAVITRSIRSGLDRLLHECHEGNALVWAHNLGIARNLILTRELARICQQKKIPLVSHHHDWWFDNRWLRWPEMRRFGFRTLATAARAIFPEGPNVRHLTINQSDAAQLHRHLKSRAGWLPNLTERIDSPSQQRLGAARKWLKRQLNDSDAPVWILPCRLLRRKNVAEALLLTRWLRPEAWLVTTGGVSSADETSYAETILASAAQHHWRLRLGILSANESRKPTVAELLAASEAVLLTSIQEGFGLPYLEAAASRRPLIARRIPNIAPDLQQFGFEFPQDYDEILVSPALFDWRREYQRQVKLFDAWRKQLPDSCQKLVGEPALLGVGRKPGVVPFSRLTLSAQLEVLTHPVQNSWDECAPLNPFLIIWKKRAGREQLKLTPWPRTADHWLSGPAYAQRFHELTSLPIKGKVNAQKADLVQRDFIREKITAQHLFPLLWSKQS